MNAAGRFVASLVLAVAGLAACGLATDLVAPESTPPVLAEVTCALPTGICDQLSAELGGNMPGVLRAMAIDCDPGPCSRAFGAGTALLTYPDGRVEMRPWAYKGDPNPLPDPTCLRVEAALCAQLAHEHMDALPPDLHILSVQVSCRGVRGCARGEGTADIVATDSLGVPHRSSSDWWGGGPGSTAPPPDAKTPAP